MLHHVTFLPPALGLRRGCRHRAKQHLTPLPCFPGSSQAQLVSHGHLWPAASLPWHLHAEGVVDGQGQQQVHLPLTSTVSYPRMPCSSPAVGSLDLSARISRRAHLGPQQPYTQLPWARQESKPTTAPACQPLTGKCGARQGRGLGARKVNQLLWHCGSSRDSAGFPELCVLLRSAWGCTAGTAFPCYCWAAADRESTRALELVCSGSLQPDLPIHQPQLASPSSCLFSSE